MGRRERDSQGSRLREARRGIGVSLSDFASMVGYSRSYLSAVELGHLPETEQIVMAYESALKLDRGTLQTGKQSVARVLHKMGALVADSYAGGEIDHFQLPTSHLVSISTTDLARAAISLMVEARSLPPGRIVLTSCGEEDWFGDSESLYRQWIAVLQDLMTRGWTITHVLRLDDNVERSLKLFESTLPLLVDYVRYRPLFLSTSDRVSASEDSVLVEGCGVIFALRTLSPERVGAIFVREREAMQALEEHAELLIHAAEPLIEPISRDDPAAFSAHLSRMEHLPGDRFLVRDAIFRWPHRAESQEWWFGANPGQQMDFPGSQVETQDQFGAFLQNVSRHRHRDIAMKSRLEELARLCLLIQEGLVLTDGAEQFQPHVFVAQVRNAIQSLQTLPNYEIALLDQTEVHLIQAERTESVVYWLVKGGKELLLESWPRFANGERRHLHLAIHEPSIAAAFQEHFKNIWARITPRNRDREYVVWWLERLLEPLADSGM